MLRALAEEEWKSCDSDVGGCGRKHPVHHILEGEPLRTFALQLAWEPRHQDSDTIADTLRILGQVQF